MNMPESEYPGITHDQFPKQSVFKNLRIRVCFNYDTDPAHIVMGTVVRDDAEEPGRMIIKLDDDRYVLSTECMWSPVV